MFLFSLNFQIGYDETIDDFSEILTQNVDRLLFFIIIIIIILRRKQFDIVNIKLHY